jgi:hypothetical protein
MPGPVNGAEPSRFGDRPSIRAALAAASACCNAYIGVPAARFDAVCRKANAADALAQG